MSGQEKKDGKRKTVEEKEAHLSCAIGKTSQREREKVREREKGKEEKFVSIQNLEVVPVIMGAKNSLSQFYNKIL